MQALIARILLRYIAGALVSYGLIGLEIGDQVGNDPDLAIALGIVIGAITEAAYVIARKRRLPT